ncbi:MAG: phosphopantetheine adenylyltransferase [Bradymonadia bacterium]
MSALVLALLLLSALIHLLPMVGVLGPARLQRLYGVPVTDPTLALSMRHRAIMFGALAGLLIAGAVEPLWRMPAVGATLLSDVAFLVLWRVTPGVHSAMRKVVIADVISIVCLGLVFALHFSGF